MTKTAKKTATPDLSPTELAKQRALSRQRFLMARALLRRRRKKSHQ